jgi:hypothetical protein
MAAFAASILPARPIEPEPSRRIVHETGAFMETSNMSVDTGFSSTSSETSFALRSVIGTPFDPSTVKGIIT